MPCAASTRTLVPGQAFWVLRNEATGADAVFNGPVGNQMDETFTVYKTKWNLFNFAQGKELTIDEAFQSTTGGSPQGSTGGADDGDEITFIDTDGSWRRIQKQADGTWYDFKEEGPTTYKLKPGMGYYYYRQDVTDMDVDF